MWDISGWTRIQVTSSFIHAEEEHIVRTVYDFPWHRVDQPLWICRLKSNLPCDEECKLFYSKHLVCLYIPTTNDCLISYPIAFVLSHILRVYANRLRSHSNTRQSGACFKMSFDLRILWWFWSVMSSFLFIWWLQCCITQSNFWWMVCSYWIDCRSV